MNGVAASHVSLWLSEKLAGSNGKHKWFLDGLLYQVLTRKDEALVARAQPKAHAREHAVRIQDAVGLLCTRYPVHVEQQRREVCCNKRQQNSAQMTLVVVVDVTQV